MQRMLFTKSDQPVERANNDADGDAQCRRQAEDHDGVHHWSAQQGRRQ